MENRVRLTEKAQIRQQVWAHVAEILPLQQQMRACLRELSTIIITGRSGIEKDRVKELKDQIFACRIETQSRYVLARRLHTKTRNN